MEIKLKENIIFKPFVEKKDLRLSILNFIMDSKTNKILYKGDPTLINPKLLKKIININNMKENLQVDDFGDVNIKNVYNKLINKINCKYCIIYKK
jgi:hypothetical protein